MTRRKRLEVVDLPEEDLAAILDHTARVAYPFGTLGNAETALDLFRTPAALASRLFADAQLYARLTTKETTK